MTAPDRFAARLAACPLIGIIRGVRPAEVEAIGDALVEAGLRIIEVPLNSPDPLASIARLARRFGAEVSVGAGTVVDPGEVADVREAGGELIVSPNTDQRVIAATAEAGLVSCPGFFTPSEAFEALRAGAHALKLFPAEAASAATLKAQLAVLPKAVPVLAVGGITPENMGGYLAAGARGFGLGSGLYAPGRSPAEVAARARRYLEAITS